MTPTPRSDSSLDRIRTRLKAGNDPREVLIEEYRIEWVNDLPTALSRWRRWRGTPTGDTIKEGARRAGVSLP